MYLPGDPVAFEFSNFTTIPEITDLYGVVAGGLPGALTFTNSGSGYLAYIGRNFLASNTPPISSTPELTSVLLLSTIFLSLGQPEKEVLFLISDIIRVLCRAVPRVAH